MLWALTAKGGGLGDLQVIGVQDLRQDEEGVGR